MLAEATESKVEVLDPFSLVDVDRNTKANMPDHVGRLAPLVGLLVADETGPDRLLDFLNPRKRVEVVESPYRKYLIAAVPVAVAALAAFFIYRQLGALDVQIEALKVANNGKQEDVKAADVSIARTEMVDKYLDGDVNWLNEIRRLAAKVPESDKLIVRSVSAVSDPRSGGGTMTVVGAVTKPAVIEEFEAAMRDDFRTVQGDGASELRTSDQYRWSFTETIKIDPVHIRNQRYIGIREVIEGVDRDAKQVDAEQVDAEEGDDERSTDAPATSSEGEPLSDSEGGTSPKDDLAAEGEKSTGADSGNGAGEEDSAQVTEEVAQESDKDSGEDSPDGAAPQTDPNSGKSDADDSPTEGGSETKIETSREREPAADDEVVAEIQTEVKS